MTVATTLEHLLGERSTLVVDGDRRIDDLGVRAGRLAAGLARRGVRRGDSVAIQLGNTVEAMTAYRACWRLGARAVAVHHRLASAELGQLLDLVRPSMTLQSVDHVTHLVDDGEAADVPEIAATPDDDAVVLFTAGSTGVPKGVRHTHRSLVYKTQLMVEVHDLTGDDVVLMPAPLAHISGLLNGVLVAGAAGMTTVLQQRWSPAEALELIEREGVTFMIGPPTFFVDLMDASEFRPERVRSLRTISSGGAGVATEFVERAEAELGAVVKRSYGSTEAPTVATSLATDDPEKRRTTDGHAIGGVELAVADSGELLVRGPELFAGYLSEAQTREAVDVEGWFHTGDLAEIDDDGWLTIVGRLKDIVIRAGENISTREVEDVLRRHPDIVDAAAVGLPHPRLGEQLGVAIAAGRPVSVDECRAWFAAEGLAPFKAPELVVVVPALPMLPTGKVDREAVRGLVQEGSSTPADDTDAIS